MYKIDTAQTRRRPRPGATRGEWWRFSLYELRDGCIRPAKGAKLEWYDPWPRFADTRKLAIGQAPASAQPDYQSLLSLVHQLEYRPGHVRYPDCLTQKSQDLILGWCQHHGLLGILLSRWEAISLAPQPDRAGLWTHHRYFRGFGDVLQTQDSSGDVSDRTPSVFIHGLNDLILTEERPSDTWSRFFPSVEFSKRDSFPYPRPYTVEFCELYGEPLMDFCKAAKLLVDAISHLRRKPAEIKGDPKVAREQALDVINLLRRPIASVLGSEQDGSLRTRRVAPSLLASFADMFADDLSYGRPTLQCRCCSKLFVSSAYQAQYCSVSCRLRDQKRRLRAQMKQASALHAEGQSLAKIAASVQQPLEIVKGWLKKAKRKPASDVARQKGKKDRTPGHRTP
jgi:hypothetical protein